MALEQPKYELIETFGEIEFRQYSPFWIAECHLPNISDVGTASSYAFGRLFRFIQGNNSQEMSIAMTKPVRQEQVDGGWKVSFVIPANVQKRGIPVPEDSSIETREIQGGLYAVLVYRGSWDQKKQNKMAERLTKEIAASRYRVSGPLISAVYNPPFTPGPLRRNEVMFQVVRN